MNGLKPIDARLAAALVVVAMAALFGWQMFAVRQTALREAGEQTMALARTAELQVIGNLRAADMLASDLDNLLAGHDLDDLGLQPTLRTRLASDPDLRSLALVDTAGREVQSVARTREAGGLAPAPEPDIIVTSRPLVAVDGAFLGTAVIGVAARPVLDVLAALPLGAEGRAWLTGADGRVIAAVPPGAADAAPPLAAHAPARVLRVHARDGGVERVVAARLVEGYPLVIAVGMAVDTILASWRENLVWYGSAVLALAVLALVYAWMLDHQSRGVAAARREKARVLAAAAAHQRGILDATVDGLITITADGHIQGLNRSAERIFGYSESELLGEAITALMPALADGPTGWKADCQGVLTGARKDGRALPLDVAVTELPTPDPAPGAPPAVRLFIATVRDISERRAAEAALRASQERNAAILAAAADGIIATDTAGRMETVNAAAARIFGYGVEDMIGREITMLMPEPYRPSHDERIAECIESGRLPSLGNKREVIGVRQDGAEFPLELAISTLERPEGSLFIAVFADIAQRKEAEAALRSAKLDAEAANQAKTQFLAHMSHELRTPLNAIIGFSDMMKHEMMGSLSPVYLDYARNINDSGRQLIGIIDDLLDVSRLQLGKFALSDGVVDLHSAVAGALAMMRPRAEDSGVVLTEGVDQALPKLRGDARAIRQVLINLVSNAVKFTPRGGLVRVSAETADDGRLLLAVADNGRGIPPELIGRVLDPFHHADAFKANKSRGIGLGLPICRWLMELHGGSLTIESTIQIGTTVVAGFPKERVLEHLS